MQSAETNFQHESYDSFARRHIGPNEADIAAMLQEVGYENIDALIDATVPKNIRLDRPLNLPAAKSEHEALAELRAISKKNKVARSFIGAGYSDCITPPVIQRNILENPGWYTAYTPYQAELAQGRLEALLNFQTMITDLTAMDIANASLLDEATAAAEAMALCHAAVAGIADPGHKNRFFVANNCHPQTIAVVQTRAKPLGIEVVIGDFAKFKFKDSVFGALVQYPATDGAIFDYGELVRQAHEAGALVVVAADILALTLLKPPGEFGADVAIGNTQRFGVPLGFGGPHAAYFATRDQYKRHMAGRLVGVSHDADGRPGYRLALQTREQHIRRDKATSNICTAQVLLAVIASMYAVYHGPRGLRAIAERVHRLTSRLADSLRNAGFKIVHEDFFDTLHVDLGEKTNGAILKRAAKAGMNLRKLGRKAIGISLDETTTEADIDALVSTVCEASDRRTGILPVSADGPPARRSSSTGWKPVGRDRLEAYPPSLCATHFPIPYPSGFQHASHRDRDAALFEEARVARSLAHDFDDSARLVHDEVECDRGDVSDLVAGNFETPSFRA